MVIVVVAYAVAALPAVAAFAQAPHALGLAAAARWGHSAARAGGVRFLRADVSVTLPTPLGIVFEEVEPGAAKGLMVAGLVRNRECSPARNSALVPRVAFRALVPARLLALLVSHCGSFCRCPGATPSGMGRSWSVTSSLPPARLCSTRAISRFSAWAGRAQPTTGDGK